MEKHLVAQWTFTSFFLFGERIYKLSNGEYLRERWNNWGSIWLPCSPNQFEELLEERDFPYLES
ncbi:MAG: hypothetical protein ACFFDH_13555 [Promethearchaeota archaeon]